MKHSILALALICFGSAAVLARSGPPASNERVARIARIALGRQVFESNCASCHGPGIGNRTIPALLEERTDLTPETVAYFVRNGVSVMAPFRKTEINDAQLAALGAYLGRNNPDLQPSRGNGTQ